MLSAPIIPSHITIDHIPHAVAADIGQAPRYMILWGVVCASIGSVKTWQQLVAARFLLGIAEAGFSVSLALVVKTAREWT